MKKNQTSFIVNDTTVPVFAVWQRNLRFGFIYHLHKWIRFVWLLLFYRFLLAERGRESEESVGLIEPRFKNDDQCVFLALNDWI